MSRFLDKRLSSLKAYIPGEQPKLGEFIKLNTNEFPYPPAKCVFESASKAVENMNLYSDLTCKELKERFKDVFGYGGNNVIFTNGSDDALYLCFLTFCGEDCGAAFADITYGFYSVYADLCCVDKQIIPLNDVFAINHADYFGLNKTIFIANPNAPTGKRLSNNQIEEILINNRDNIVVIDEAYTAFSGESCVELLPKYDNLVIVGTFSKSRGMAGARLGYIITSEDIASDLEKVKFSINPYNVNSLTQAVGTTVLENNDYYVECINEICKTRDKFSEELVKLGFDVIPSKANFVFAKHNSISGKYIFEELKKRKILIRRFDKERIDEYLRISIGTPEQMQIVINALAEIVGGIK
ncbi:MAG: histidinol-phosphate transaminase [Clostridia bacterium]|nr:histidinol-phosphate transaminase [Clostridia bacterium]